MELDDAINAINKSLTQPELNHRLQSIIEEFGFASYSFVDAGAPHLDEPYWTSTTGEAWENTYIDNKFIHTDVMVQQARRTNSAFTWGEVALPVRRGKRKSGALRVMEAAEDHGFRDGLVIPFHFVDDRGAVCSSLCTLFWAESRRHFDKNILENKAKLHLILIYYTQKSVELRANVEKNGAVVSLFNRSVGAKKGSPLTDREREVLCWAARGKTTAETADILTISAETVSTHLKNSIEKLQAGNKTHAVAKGVYLGIIDI